MIDESGKPWPTEFTCRFGWPIENMMLGATEGDPVAWMKDALEGKDSTSFKEDIGCCLVLAHGEFPHGKEPAKEYSDVPVYGVTKGNKKHIHPQAIKIDVLPDMDGDKVTRRPLWNTAGDYAAVVTGFGKSVKQACERAYKTTKQLHISNMAVRDDVGEKLEETLPKLHKLGYATHCKYD
jgi:phosphoribosylamine-glycine ligase